jgi:hypothetical protein
VREELRFKINSRKLQNKTSHQNIKQLPNNMQT